MTEVIKNKKSARSLNPFDKREHKIISRNLVKRSSTPKKINPYKLQTLDQVAQKIEIQKTSTMSPADQKEIIRRIKQGPLSIKIYSHPNLDLKKLKQVSFVDGDGQDSKFSSVEPKTEDYRSTLNLNNLGVKDGQQQAYQSVKNRKTTQEKIQIISKQNKKLVTKEFQTQTIIMGQEIATQTVCQQKRSKDIEVQTDQVKQKQQAPQVKQQVETKKVQAPQVRSASVVKKQQIENSPSKPQILLVNKQDSSQDVLEKQNEPKIKEKKANALKLIRTQEPLKQSSKDQQTQTIELPSRLLDQPTASKSEFKTIKEDVIHQKNISTKITKKTQVVPETIKTAAIHNQSPQLEHQSFELKDQKSPRQMILEKPPQKERSQFPEAHDRTSFRREQKARQIEPKEKIKLPKLERVLIQPSKVSIQFQFQNTQKPTNTKIRAQTSLLTESVQSQSDPVLEQKISQQQVLTSQMGKAYQVVPSISALIGDENSVGAFADIGNFGLKDGSINYEVMRIPRKFRSQSQVILTPVKIAQGLTNVRQAFQLPKALLQYLPDPPIASLQQQPSRRYRIYHRAQ